MNPQVAQKNKSVFALALISALASVLFSFMGAPFLRAFSVSARPVVFWSTAVVLVGALFLLGSMDYRISETAVYVGAIWMTLGTYSELEKRGVSWKSTSFFALVSGTLFTVAGYFLILRNQNAMARLTELVEPISTAASKAFPEFEAKISFINYLPGFICAGLLGSLALGLVFEAKVAKLFNLKRERVASGLRWLDFRLPSVVIWASLFSVLFSDVKFEGMILQHISVNILIVAVVAFFIQGITVVEFMLRFYRLGLLTRASTYLLIILQLAPFVVLAGFADFWVDFRTRVRKKTKATKI